jgi:hypothetical protein
MITRDVTRPLRSSSGVDLLIDSGDDVTLLPEYAVKALGATVEQGPQYE